MFTKKVTIAATGLPGNPINGVLFISPKANGLSGLIANFQNYLPNDKEFFLPYLSTI